MATTCGLCNLPLTPLIIPKGLATLAQVRGFRLSPSEDWVEKDVCVCCDLLDRYMGVCHHQREKRVRDRAAYKESHETPSS